MVDFILIVSGILFAIALVMLVVSFFVDDWTGEDLLHLSVKFGASGFALGVGGVILTSIIYFFIA